MEYPVHWLLMQRYARVRFKAPAVGVAVSVCIFVLLGFDGIFAFLFYPLVSTLALASTLSSMSAFLRNPGCQQEWCQTNLRPSELRRAVVQCCWVLMRRGVFFSLLIFSAYSALLQLDTDIWFVVALVHGSSFLIPPLVASCHQTPTTWRKLPAYGLLLLGFYLPNQLDYYAFFSDLLYPLAFFVPVTAAIAVHYWAVCTHEDGARPVEAREEAKPVLHQGHRIVAENPIVYREWSRESKVIPGRLGLFVSRYGVTALLVLFWSFFACSMAHQSGLRAQLYMLVALGLLLVIQPFRAAVRVGGASLEEKFKATGEMVRLTQITPQEFVDGWARVGFDSRLRETLGLAPVCLGSFYFSQYHTVLQSGSTLVSTNFFYLSFLWLITVLAFTVFGAYLGVALSGVIRSGGELLLGLLPGLLGLGMISFWGVQLLQSVGLPGGPVPALLALGLAALLRSRALLRFR